MNGLFSNNPEMTRAMNYGVNLAGVPAGRAALALSPVMGQMAQQATGGLLSGLGVESPEAKKERALQGILGGINPQDANSLADASRKLMGMGLSAEAAKLMEQAQQVAKNTAEVGKLNAEAGKAESWLGNEEAKRALEERYREADRALKEKLAKADDARQASLVQAQINKLNKEAQLAGVKLAGGGWSVDDINKASEADVYERELNIEVKTIAQSILAL
jgi:polyhydroxyalkanoate synthesis regulator phasin